MLDTAPDDVLTVLQQPTPEHETIYTAAVKQTILPAIYDAVASVMVKLDLKQFSADARTYVGSALLLNTIREVITGFVKATDCDDPDALLRAHVEGLVRWICFAAEIPGPPASPSKPIDGKILTHEEFKGALEPVGERLNTFLNAEIDRMGDVKHPLGLFLVGAVTNYMRERFGPFDDVKALTPWLNSAVIGLGLEIQND